MRAGSVGRRARAGADVGCASSTGSTTVVAVAVDTGIGRVRNLGAVGAVGTGGVIIASCASSGMRTGRANASSVAGGTDTSVSASRADATGVAGGTDTGVGASGADTSGVASGTNTGVSTSRADASGVSSSRTKATSVCAGRAKTAGVAGRANASGAVVSVGVDTGVNNVSDTAVRSVSAGGVIVARYMAAAGCAGVSAGVASAAEARCAGVRASGANTSGVSSGADTGCSMGAGCAVSASRASGRAMKSVNYILLECGGMESYLARPSTSESMRGSAALVARLE